MELNGKWIRLLNLEFIWVAMVRIGRTLVLRWRNSDIDHVLYINTLLNKYCTE